ncbi:MAG: glycoside hydrolase family 97 protein, partial [Bryobacteraceae bacterium]
MRTGFFRTLSIAALMALPMLAQQSYSLRSPDGRIELRIRAGERLAWDVLVRGREVLKNSTASITVDGTRLGAPFRVR